MATYYNPGAYICEVVGQAMGESSTGNPQFILRFKVLGTPAGNGEYNVAEQQYERTHYRSITEKTVYYFINDLKTLGFKRDSFRFLDPNVPGFHDFKGQVVTMVCSHETDQKGAERERWGVARESSAIEVKPLESKKMRELDALYGKHLKQTATASVPMPVGAVAPSQEVEITDDDIPF